MKLSRNIGVILAVLAIAALATGGILWLNDSREGVTNTADSGPFRLAGSYQVRVVVEPDPPRVGKNRVTIIVRDAQDQPVTGAEVRAVAQMPAMGSMPTMIAAADIEETAPGRYQGEFELPMSGAWPLAVDVHSAALGHGDLSFDLATGRKGLGLATATIFPITPAPCTPR